MINIDFTNKNILITGGNSGMGQAIVKEFIKTGGNVAFTYCHSLPSSKYSDKAYFLNQSDTASIKPTIERIVKEIGKIDILVNNAGIYPAKNFFEIKEEDYDQMLDTNAKAIFFLCQTIYDYMNPGGAIVNISSINATNPAGRLIHYGMSKSAVEMLSKCLAYEFKEKIRVNCIAPGLIYKEGQEKFIPGWRESYCERSALHRLVNGEDIANTAIFLASDLSSAITGQIITVDCGVSLAPYFDNAH